MENAYCDWLTVSQEHHGSEHHTPCSMAIILDADGEVIDKKRVPLQVPLAHDSSVRIYSDGSRVQFSGNPSRAGRRDNYIGLDLETAKARVNELLADQGLPPMTSDARISRVDLCENYAAGAQRSEYMYALRCMKNGRLLPSNIEHSVYWGKTSRYRTVRAYDKAAELRQQKRNDVADEAYVARLADYCESAGVVRLEAQFNKACPDRGLREWDHANNEAATAALLQEVDPMTKITGMDLEAVPMPYLATLMMFIGGVDPRKHMHERTWKKHYKALKALGYDISLPNPIPLRAKREVIVLEPAGVPDWYEMPDQAS